MLFNTIHNEVLSELIADLDHTVDTITEWHRKNGESLSNNDKDEIKTKLNELLEKQYIVF
jgi:hypothetical protein